MIEIERILNLINHDIMSDKLRIKNWRDAGVKISVRNIFNATSAKAYTNPIGHNKYKIFIGGELIREIAHCPDGFKNKKDFAPFYPDLIDGFIALNAHEMGHIKFTDMVSKDIAEYEPAKYRGFLHTLFNIMEDPIVERAMCVYYDHLPGEIDLRPCFDLLVKSIFYPQCEAYHDTGNVGSFINYLLLAMRCGSKHIKEHNAVYDKYSKDLLPLIKDIIYQTDATQRLRLTIKLGEWIINNIKEFNWEEVASPDRIIDGKEPTAEGDGGGTSKKIAPASGAKMPIEEDDGDDSGFSDDDADDDKTEEGSKRIEESVIDDIEESLDSVFDDDFSDIASGHDFVNVMENFDIDPSVSESIDNQIAEFNDTIQDVSKFLNLVQSRVKPRRTEGFKNGILNMPRAMRNEMINGYDTKLFVKKVERGEMCDLAISLLCDNSGSMVGAKSSICSRGAVALAQACDWTGIPFECNAFTKTNDTRSGICVTLEIKRFEDSFSKVKHCFGINDDDLGRDKFRSDIPVPIFSGNSEEVNLWYIWQRLRANKHKTKVLFVLCDGCTTGSKARLKEVIRQIEDDGITVIGIGICCTEVQQMYPNSKIFRSINELNDELAQYLVDTLSDLAVGH